MKTSRKKCVLLLIFVDLLSFFLADVMSLLIVKGELDSFSYFFFIVAFFQILGLFAFRIYKVRLLDSSLELAVRGLGQIIGALAGFVIVYNSSFFEMMTFRLFFSYAILSYFATMGYRVIYRYFMYNHNRRINCGSTSQRKNAIVYGAGETGKALASQAAKGKLHYNIIGFIDDDEDKADSLIMNKPVMGKIKDIENILLQTDVKVFIIAVTQLSAENMQKAVSAANAVGAEIKIVPSLFEIESGKKKSLDLRTLDYSDLLGRDLIEIDREPIREMITDKVVLVTGACGSIGSEIARQAKTYNPKQLLILDIDESGLHDNALRLLHYSAEWSEEVTPILCDIKNKDKIDAIMAKYKPDLIFHAAAYKHVPMVQLYPEEGIRTNIGGSYNVLSSAIKNKVKKVVVISTDKAVNPTNVMGASKRMVELEAAMLDQKTKETDIVCVRFGNVLGSRGSMLPLFIEEIQEKVPITVTSKDIIRYFMAIPEAVSLVFLAGTMGKGGEVMVLDMGKPMNIYEFAKKLIHMYGNPAENEIKITGLRDGEKMYEELLANKDNTIPTENKLIFKAKLMNNYIDEEIFKERIKRVYKEEPEILKQWLKESVPEFKEGE